MWLTRPGRRRPLRLRHRDLREPGFPVFRAAVDLLADFGARRKFLDLDLALELIRALDDGERAPRRSAYFICAFMPDVPRYISARMPALRSSVVMRW